MVVMGNSLLTSAQNPSILLERAAPLQSELVQPLARRPHAAQDGFERGPTQIRKLP